MELTKKQKNLIIEIRNEWLEICQSGKDITIPDVEQGVTDLYALDNRKKPLILATKGKPKRINAGISQIIESIPDNHSSKPDMVRKRIIELCGDLPRIELFARTKVYGWDVWGNDEKLDNTPLDEFII